MEDILFKSDFLIELDYFRIFAGIVILFICTSIIEWIYRKYIFSNDNKEIFGKNMFPFALAMFLIVAVIKTSIALSLGLVGALSIIRFRTAIKEPGQLINLLVLTGIAIAMSAEKEILAVIMTVVYSLHAILSRKHLDQEKISSYKLLRIQVKTIDFKLHEVLHIEGFSRLYKDINGVNIIEFNLKSFNDVESIIERFDDVTYEIL